MTRSLAELTAGLLEAPADVRVSDVTLDSREVRPGTLFLAMRGARHHGLQFLPQVLAGGARAVLYEPRDRPQSLPAIPAQTWMAPLPQLAQHAGVIADRFFGAPSARLTVAGITGTNGKTTCAWLLAQALRQCRGPAAYMGTLGYGLPSQLVAGEHTTADAVSLQRQLAALAASGAAYVSMEVSSHALDQQRVAGVRFNTAAFTNLTRDHLDYHGTMAAYGDAKARLFAWPGLAQRIVNVDDPFGARLAATAGAGRLIVSCRTAEPVAADGYVRASRVVPTESGLIINLDTSWGSAQLPVRLIGEFNADNVITVLAVMLGWEIPLAEAVRALSASRAAIGRMEMFGGGTAPLAIVDYAHTPDALAKALRATRQHCRGRLRVVFGCGGDRDAGKRPLMGQIAAELADEVILTDDNPRTEDPVQIVAQIRAGIPGQQRVLVEHDRARAIESALARSTAADAVLIAGKGHEDYQIVGRERRPFSDQRVVARALGELPA
ncbi:MAG: UDP-N-acetylmuramoyl-L-alanyl-D-glutamate--2,6-diaminopimelate ligase [Proteobacteria bacterium]|nr:UDP-N-acetylmuramoyl-L-alanyl-D-glutamate--2,6-diaminopimelate ligase [Pseudomonadota bacterium]